VSEPHQRPSETQRGGEKRAAAATARALSRPGGRGRGRGRGKGRMAGGARGAVSVPCPVVKGEIVEVEVAEEEEPEDVSWKPSEVRACLATGRFVACVNGDEDFNEEFWPEEEVSVGLYKIVFQFKALLWKSIILLLPPPHLQSLPYRNTIARPLRSIRPPIDPPFVSQTHTKLVMTISCKGQGEWQPTRPLRSAS